MVLLIRSAIGGWQLLDRSVELGCEHVTSSASMPTIVAIMLGHLEAHPDHTVLEMGTGTGYNAALLAHRIGAQAVTTIEVDAELADRARRALIGAGFGDVTVVTGDGAEGHVPGAPYDRVISTAAVQRVPYPWVAQTRPGGLIVTPWGTDYENGNLLVLDVDGEGVATGRIVDTASFMWLRDHRSRHARVSQVVHDEDQPEVRSCELHPYRVAGHRDVCTAIGLRVPQCHHRYRPANEDDPEGTVSCEGQRIWLSGEDGGCEWSSGDWNWFSCAGATSGRRRARRASGPTGSRAAPGRRPPRRRYAARAARRRGRAARR